MEITTCEGYVIEKLHDLERENMRLASRVEQLEAALEWERRSPGQLARAIEEVGRRVVFEDASGYCNSVIAPDGHLQGYCEWVDSYVWDRKLPDGVTMEEFAQTFERELEEAYERQLEKYPSSNGQKGDEADG